MVGVDFDLAGVDLSTGERRRDFGGVVGIE
jgi:hypothetical protein